jgi:hypothetical protein
VAAGGCAAPSAQRSPGRRLRLTGPHGAPGSGGQQNRSNTYTSTGFVYPCNGVCQSNTHTQQQGRCCGWHRLANLDVPLEAGACTFGFCRVMWCGGYHSAVKSIQM